VATSTSSWGGEPRSKGTLQRAREQLDWPSDREFRVLSLDGGGIKGLFTAAFLARLESDRLGGRSIADRFDLIAGTSTGGIIALALGLGLTANSVLELYLNAGREIFPRKRSFGIFRPAFSAAALRRELVRLFGSRTLGETQNRLCIPSADGKHGDVAVFKTPHHPDYQKDWKLAAVDVALATSAAPTLLRVHDADGYRFVDGGLWANNPVMVALVDALACFKVSRRKVRILSIGSGSRVPVLQSFELFLGGAVGWIGTGRLFESMMHYGSLNADGQAGLLIGRDRLLRVQPGAVAARNVHMTDYARAKELLPEEADILADQLGEEIASSFLCDAVPPAVFYYGPRAA
jgi:uncharacterized protein